MTIDESMISAILPPFLPMTKARFFMNMDYMDKAQEKIENTPMLVNLISYRTRQLNAGARPMVKKDHPEQDNHDIALKEIAEGLLTVEMNFSQENEMVDDLDFNTSILL